MIGKIATGCSECTELSGVGGIISSSHVVSAHVTINSNTLIHKLHVVDDEALSCDALLGLDFLNLPGMVLTHTKSGSTLQYEPLLSHNNEPSTIESILNEFKAMATTGTKIPTPITIGEFNYTTLTITLCQSLLISKEKKMDNRDSLLISERE
jgi:hypothetical protein